MGQTDIAITGIFYTRSGDELFEQNRMKMIAERNLMTWSRSIINYKKRKRVGEVEYVTISGRTTFEFPVSLSEEEREIRKIIKNGTSR